MANIPQPPRSPLDPQRPESINIWRRWFEDITKAFKDVFSTTEANIFGWNSVNKAGSNIAQIETRNHNDLLNIKGSVEGYHLSAADYLAAVDLADTIALTGNVTAGLVVHIDPTDNLDGTLTLPAIQVNLFDNSTFLNKPATYSIVSGTTGVAGIPALTDNSVNYIIVEYNSGSPKYNVVTDVTLINWSNNTPYMTVYRDGTDLHQVNWCAAASGLADKVNMRMIKTRRFEREEGLLLSESATRIVNITAGISWNGANRQTLNAFASNVDEWHLYKHVAGVWTKDSSTTQYNNTQYDDGTDLQTLVANRYTINWIYRGAEQPGHAFYVLGSQQYVLLETAQAAVAPTDLPDIINKHAFLVGRIIVQKNASTAVKIDSAFDITFATAPITDHGALTGLADDDHTQYALLAGRSGGQSLQGGSAAGENLTIGSTAHATKGKILFGTSAYDEVNNSLGIGTTAPSAPYKIDVFSNVAVTDVGIRAKNSQVGRSSYITLDSNQNGAGENSILFYKSGVLEARFLHYFTGTQSNLYLENRTAGGDIKFNVNTTVEAVTIKPSGLMGVGTTAPSAPYKIDVFNNVAVTDVGIRAKNSQVGRSSYITLDSNQNGAGENSILFYKSGVLEARFLHYFTGTQSDLYFENRTASGDIKFNVNTTVEAVTIKPSGKTGFMTTSPNATVTVKAVAAQAYNLTEWLNSSAAVLSSKSVTGVDTSPNYISTVATGTQPYACTSTTVNTNLNSDLLDSQHGTYYLDRTNHTGITTNYNGIATEGYGHPAIVDLVALTAQTADITSTNFTNAGTAGLYRINYYLETTTADAAAGAVTLTVSFTDGAGATTVASSALTLTTVGRTSGVFFVRLATGSVAYDTTHSGSYGTSAYALHAICERVN